MITLIMSSVLAEGMSDDDGTSIDVSTSVQNGSEEINIELDFHYQMVEAEGRYYEVPFITGGFHVCIDGYMVPCHTTEIPVDGFVTDLFIEFASPMKRILSPAPYSHDGIGNAEVEREEGSVEIINRYEIKQIERTWDRQDVLSIRLFPVHYQKSGEATIYHEVKVSYRLTQPTSPNVHVSSSRKPVGSIAYLIITTNELKDSVMPLARWKSQKGLFTHVETVEDIRENVSGRDIQEKIRNYIIELHRKEDLRYLFLAGDYEDVPARETTNRFVVDPLVETDYFVSDIYYACIDEETTWDIDGDGIFGEKDDIDDLYPDLFYGRLAIGEPDRMKDKINELIGREKDPRDHNNSKKVLLISAEEREIEDFEVALDRLNDLGELDTCKLYCNESGDEVLSPRKMVSHLEETYPFIFYSGHGYPDEYLDLMDVNDVRSMNQAQLGGYLFAMSCDTGWFDDPHEYGLSHFKDCISEELTENVGVGVVGCTAASRVSVTSPDTSKLGDSHGLMEAAMESLDMMENGDIPAVGGAPHVYSVWEFVNDFYPFTLPYDTDLRTYLEYNYFGDPNAPIFLRDPASFKMDIHASPDGTFVTVNVTDNEDNVQDGIFVTLYREGELGIWGETDRMGFVRIDLPENNGGTINVTATRSGDKPCISTIVLPDTMEPMPTLTTYPFSPDGQNGIFVSKPRVTIYADEESTIEYRLNGVHMGSSDTEVELTLRDGNNIMEVKATDTVGHISEWISFEIPVDTRRPELGPMTDPQIPDGVDGWYVTRTVLFLGSDEDLIRGNISIDGGDPIDMKDPILLLEGSHSYTLRGMDLAGLTNKTTVVLCLDTDTPNGQISLSHEPDGLNGFYVSRPTITFDLDDELSYAEYRLGDTDSWNRFDETFELPDGEHLFQWRVVDQAGNTGTSGQRYFKIDTDPPQFEYELFPEEPDGSKGYYNSTPTFYVNTCTDECYYSLLEQGQQVNWKYGIEIQNGQFSVPDGEWSIYLMTVDPAGNSLEVGPMVMNVDTLPPALEIEMDPPYTDGSNGWYISTVQIFLTGTERYDLTEMSYNGGEWTSVDDIITLEEGVFDLRIRSIDRAGNRILVDIGEIRIDTHAPVISDIHPSRGDTVGKESAEISFEISDRFDPSILTFISIDGSGWIDLGNRTEHPISDLEDGKHNFRIMVLDQAGNTDVQNHYFTIDRTAPEIIFMSPENGEMRDGRSEIFIELSEAVDIQSAIISVDGEQVAVQWSTSKAFTMDLERYGTDDTVHTISIEGTDLHGNVMENVRVEFYFLIENEEPVPEQESQNNAVILTIIILGGVVISALLIMTGVVIRKRRSYQT